jgi:hypothetical protein
MCPVFTYTGKGVKLGCSALFRLTMRSEEEIQHAHDLLGAIVTGQIPCPPDAVIGNMKRMVTVLCWVLEHEHNPTFADDLARIMAHIRTDN